jgi:hypothetical protein
MQQWQSMRPDQQQGVGSTRFKTFQAMQQANGPWQPCLHVKGLLIMLIVHRQTLESLVRGPLLGLPESNRSTAMAEGRVYCKAD